MHPGPESSSTKQPLLGQNLAKCDAPLAKGIRRKRERFNHVNVASYILMSGFELVD